MFFRDNLYYLFYLCILETTYNVLFYLFLETTYFN